MFEKLKNLAREPLLHFLLLAAGINLLYGALDQGDDATDSLTVRIGAEHLRSLSDQFSALWGRPPTADELNALIREQVRTEILYREAIAMGLDDGDMVIERRLAQKLELLAQGLVTPAEPEDELLEAWYAENIERFRPASRYTLTHVFFDPDRRDDAILDEARAARDELAQLDEVPEDIGDRGDRFMLQNYYPDRTEIELRKLFGSGFVEQIVDLEPSRWHGPVLSGYGVHLVYLNGVVTPPQPPFEAIRATLVDEWSREQVERQSEQFLDRIVDRYTIVVEETELALTTPAAAGNR